MHSSVYLFFFFQAEDGIRDHCVTGVQTCALPIFRLFLVPRALQLYLARFVFVMVRRAFWLFANHRHDFVSRDAVMAFYEIGRASCRERGEVAVWGGAVV